MMSQPIAAAWQMLRTSRGLAHRSSISRMRPRELECSRHERHGIAACVCHPAGEHRDDRARSRIERVDDGTHLSQREECGDVQSKALGGELTHQFRRTLTPGVRHRNLDVDVRAPAAYEKAWRRISSKSSEKTSKEMGRSVMWSSTFRAKPS